MTKLSHGPRSRSRQKLRRRRRDAGMVPITKYLQQFKMGTKVAIKINSSLHKGMPHHRFHGKIGTVIGSRGRAYLVEVVEGRKKKLIIANPEHLARAATITPAKESVFLENEVQ